MKKFIYLLIVLTVFVSSVNAQNNSGIKELNANAEKLFKHGSFNNALNLFLQLDLLAEGKNPYYKMQIAICYLNTNIDKTKAIDYLESIKDQAKKFGEEYYFALGRVYHLDYRLDEAINAYTKFISIAKKNDLRIKDAQRAIEMCNNAKNFILNPIKVEIKNLGPTVNTKYPEYIPVISTDESVLIFASRREGSTGGLQDTWGDRDTLYGDYNEDIYVSVSINGDWKQPLKIGATINTKGHDAPVGLSPDGEKLFIYRNDSQKWGNIFICELEGYGWNFPEKLPYPINTKSWEGSASITPDGNTLFFASNRPDGSGERDIYMVRKLPNDHWADPENLGSTINTPFNDDAPFIHPDGKTLYFSSKGHNSMGGYDIFKSTLHDDGKWSEPINLGYPINTAGDDIYFVISANGKHGYYASAKQGGYGDKDLYVIQMPKEAMPEAITLIKGFMTGCDNKVPKDARIVVKDNTTNKIVAVNRPNKVTGKYLIIIPRDMDYNIAFLANDHIPYSEQIKTTGIVKYNELIKDIELKCQEIIVQENTKEVIEEVLVVEDQVEKEKTEEIVVVEEEKTEEVVVVEEQIEKEETKEVVIVEKQVEKEKITKEASESKKIFIVVYFDFDLYTIKSTSELYELSKILNSNPNLKLTIASYTDAMGSEEYNDYLSQKRAKAVSNYLENNGLEQKRLGVLRYGERQPFAPNVTLDGKDNPTGRQLNRRVEIIVTNITNDIQTAKFKSSKLYKLKDAMVNQKDITVGIVYKIQIGAVKGKLPNEYENVFASIQGELSDNGLTLYTIGTFKDKALADKYKNLLINMGIKNPIIIAYKDGTRIPLEKAK